MGFLEDFKKKAGLGKALPTKVQSANKLQGLDATLNTSTYNPAFGTQYGITEQQFGGFNPSEQAGIYGSATADVGGIDLGGGGGIDWMGKGGAIDLGSQGLGALTGALSAYTGYKALKQAEDEFAFNKALSQANFANQAGLVNNSLQNAGEVGMSLAGNTMTAADRAARQQQLDSQKLKTTI